MAVNLYYLQGQSLFSSLYCSTVKVIWNTGCLLAQNAKLGVINGERKETKLFFPSPMTLRKVRPGWICIQIQGEYPKGITFQGTGMLFSQKWRGRATSVCQGKSCLQSHSYPRAASNWRHTANFFPLFSRKQAFLSVKRCDLISARKPMREYFASWNNLCLWM